MTPLFIIAEFKKKPTLCDRQLKKVIWDIWHVLLF